MIYDIHVHAADTGDPATAEFLSNRVKGLLGGFFLRKSLPRGVPIGPGAWKRIEEKIVSDLESSETDAAVFLALDAYRGDIVGTAPKSGAGIFSVSNAYVEGLAASSGKILAGGSVHPYRSDALERLERLVRGGCVLVKWIPSAQGIDMEDPRCRPFYEALADYGLPLLVHTGNEHFFPGSGNALNHPSKLVPALRAGVKVVAAHCGARMFLHEKCFFGIWSRMAKEWENLFGDTASFVLPTRIRYLRKLLEDDILRGKAIFGSDSPGPPAIASCVFQLGRRETSRLRKIGNLFDASLETYRALGFDDEWFSNAEKVLMLEKRGTGPSPATSAIGK